MFNCEEKDSQLLPSIYKQKEKKATESKCGNMITVATFKRAGIWTTSFLLFCTFSPIPYFQKEHE